MKRAIRSASASSRIRRPARCLARDPRCPSRRARLPAELRSAPSRPVPPRTEHRRPPPGTEKRQWPGSAFRPLRSRSTLRFAVATRRVGALVHPWSMRAEGEVVRFPTERVEARARFDEFVEDEHQRLYKALYFVTGSRGGAGGLAPEGFL